uniref:Uncharacterized protein n=1 Tax=Lactuca sativa TaxID=4236 RepID=A0A9R1VV87_LACSA|nr:hypothetical protein LSAT_V11C400213770 [Lactuca sativa]
MKKWTEIPMMKDDGFQTKDGKVKINVEAFPLNGYILMRKVNEIDLIDNIKSKVLYTEQYIDNWYIGNCFSHQMIGRKENLGYGYGKVANGKLKVNRVAYIKCLKHDLITVSQLVVDISNQVLFDEE